MILADVAIVQLDEMWHFVDGKKQMPGLESLRSARPAKLGLALGAWVPGERDDATCKQLLAKAGSEGRVFLTDDWDGYRRCIPEDPAPPYFVAKRVEDAGAK